MKIFTKCLLGISLLGISSLLCGQNNGNKALMKIVVKDGKIVATEPFDTLNDKSVKTDLMITDQIRALVDVDTRSVNNQVLIQAGEIDYSLYMKGDQSVSEDTSRLPKRVIRTIGDEAVRDAVLDPVGKYGKQELQGVRFVLDDKVLSQITSIADNDETKTSNIPIRAPKAGWELIMSEEFEGVFPSSGWNAFVPDGYADAWWDDQSYRSYGGSGSVFCADIGSQRVDAGSDYPNNMYSWMIYGPFNLSDASDAELNYMYWLESELNYDRFYTMVSIDGSSFYGQSMSGNSGGWANRLVDLKSVPYLGDVSGESSVYIAFIFLSDESINDYEGAYVDDIYLLKYVDDVTVDLVPYSISLSSETFLVGSNIDVGLTVCNNGSDPSESFYSQLYLSENTAISSSDHPLGPDIIYSSINGGGCQTQNVSATVPGIPDGDYYVGIIVDVYGHVAEENESNNIGVRSGQITIINPEPEISVSPTSLAINQLVNQNNMGRYPATTFMEEKESSDQPKYHSTGLIIPPEIELYWKTNVKQLAYDQRALKASIDWSMYDTPAKNQNSCGSCWAFAAISLVESLAKQQNGLDYDFAEQTLISCETRCNGCDGGWYGYALEFINLNMVSNERCHPYSASNGNCGTRCSDPYYSLKVNNYDLYGRWGEPTAETVNDLKYLLNSGPVVVSFYVPDSFHAYENGIFDYNGAEFSIENRGHAVLVVGYDDDLQCFKVKNSWGSQWGENGYFRIAYNDVTDDVYFGGYAVIASNVEINEFNGDFFSISNIGNSVLSVNSISENSNWLSTSNYSTIFDLDPGAGIDVSVHVNWDLLTDSETGIITINSNDPDDPNVTVTVIANPARCNITTNSSPTNGGTTSGGGTYNCGEIVTVSATANSGYEFDCWTENSDTVCSEGEYTFEMMRDQYLIANFNIANSLQEIKITDEILVYPNPTDGQVYIKTSVNWPHKLVVRLIDNKGQVLKTSELKGLRVNENYRFDISEFGSGLYILQLEGKDFEKRIKIVKK